LGIKSKSFLKAKWLKVCAVLLALATAGGMTVSIYRAVTLTEALGGSLDSLLFENQSDFTASNAFQEQLAWELYYIKQMLFVYGSEAEMRSGESLKKQEALLKEQYEATLQEKLEDARKGKEQELLGMLPGRHENGEEVAPPETTVLPTQPNTPDATTEPQITLSAEEEKEIRDQCLQEYEAQLRSLRGSFEEDYRKAKEELEGLSNLHYALVNRKTGEVFTNFQKIDPKSTDFRKLVEQYQWNETYTNDAGYHSGERVVNQTQWMSSYDYMTIRISDWFNQYNDRITLYEKEFVKNGWDVYIALNDELLPKGLDEKPDIYYTLDRDFQQAKNNLPVALAMTAICLLVYVLCAVYLTVAGGHRAETEEITLLWTDRIPNDLHLLLSGSLVILGLAAAAGLPAQILDATQGFQKLLMLAGVGCAMGAGGVLLEWLTSVARNVKRRQFWRNTLIVKFFRFLKKSWKRFRTALHNIKEDIKAHAIPNHRMENLRTSILFLFIGYLLGNVILMALTGLTLRDASYGGSPLAFLFFGSITAGFNLIALILFWKSVIALDEMMTAVSKTRQGDLSYPLDPAKMPKLLRKFGEDIVGMQDGMRTAVDEAIKGEHMKTELITNVSHDLKTPLTAIVNYVDLLKKCEISDETAREYISVLEEKSERLKHLIEDLVEASKATTGNVQLHFVKVNLYELAMQAMGENADALEAAGLDVRLNQPEQEPILFADSQKTWRIIDNLISNVKKYALAGTRVYIEVGEENGRGVFSIKNVSREPLDVPVEQLTQRFVRGDAARSTEGSGLGLSIAQSLCELQSGTLEITMDGDLFKVTVRLPLADR